MPVGSNKQIKANSRQTVAAMVERAGRDAVPIRREFVQIHEDDGTRRPGPFHLFVSANDRFGLLLYLLLLTCASKAPWDVRHHAGVWARALGADSDAGRPRVSKAWARLEDRQLVTRERSKRLARVTPLQEDGSGASYTRPTSGFMSIKHALWLHGPVNEKGRRLGKAWYEVLSLPELAVLVIAHMNADEFALPAERVPDWYGVSADTFQRGARGLEKHGLLDVSRRRKIAPLAPEGYTIENRYTLNPPFGPMNVKSAATGAGR